MPAIYRGRRSHPETNSTRRARRPFHRSDIPEVSARNYSVKRVYATTAFEWSGLVHLTLYRFHRFVDSHIAAQYDPLLRVSDRNSAQYFGGPDESAHEKPPPAFNLGNCSFCGFSRNVLARMGADADSLHAALGGNMGHGRVVGSHRRSARSRAWGATAGCSAESARSAGPFCSTDRGNARSRCATTYPGANWPQ